MGDEPNARVKVPKDVLRRSHKGRRFIQTAGRWPRKSAAAKKCVTTYLPNGSAPKMDGAQAFDRDLAVSTEKQLVLTSRRVREGRGEAKGRPKVEGPSVQILVVVAIIQVKSRLKAEGGEGFRVNSKWTRVSRP